MHLLFDIFWHGGSWYTYTIPWKEALQAKWASDMDSLAMNVVGNNFLPTCYMINYRMPAITRPYLILVSGDGQGADPVLSKTLGACSLELTWHQWWWSRIRNRKGLNFVRSLGNSMDSPYKRLDYIITTFALLLSHCPVYNDGWCQLCPTFDSMRSPLSLG